MCSKVIIKMSFSYINDDKQGALTNSTYPFLACLPNANGVHIYTFRTLRERRDWNKKYSDLNAFLAHTENNSIIMDCGKSVCEDHCIEFREKLRYSMNNLEITRTRWVTGNKE
jgi:hypothetical protein